MRRFGRLAVAGILITAASLITAAPGRAAAGAPGGIVAQLKQLPGVTYLGTNPNAPSGYRVYELEIEQPVDHNAPHGATFEQHLELYHRDVSAPMVMFVSGYFNYTSLDPTLTYLSDPAAIVGGNQISVEHRFYGKSVPEPADWSLLTVQQQAADEHHVVTVFKRLYTAKWLVTGISKGGETAIFHDYFYPHDFAGTFAWSAPSITSTFSTRYDDFLDSVGAASCRTSLVNVQIAALKQRDALETRIRAAARAAGETFNDWRAGLDEAFEVMVLQTPFVFWQYGGNCAGIPGPGASTTTLYNWYDTTVGWLAADDQESGPYFAYNYQAGAELGYPILHEAALNPWLHFTSAAQKPQEDLPPDIPAPALSQHLMRAVHDWVAANGRRLLFLYGQLDPWSAQRFALGPGTKDSVIYVIAGGMHTSPYTQLPLAQRSAFVNRLRRWAGAAAPTARLGPGAAQHAAPGAAARPTWGSS